MKKEKSSQEIKSMLGINRSWSDKIAVFITDTFGSIAFLNCCILIFMVWILWNTSLLPGLRPFDKFPFPALEMGVSIFAIILSVSVLISQNREGKLEKTRQQVEFEVNVRAENEITKILNMLHEMQKKMGIDSHDNELEVMKEDIDLHRLHQQLDNGQKAND